MSVAAPARVPFLDLGAATAELADELAEAMARVTASGRYLLGPELDAFEHAWAQACGTRHCVAVGSGLDALRLALEAHGVGPGDEVLVPGQTFVATWLAVSACGATPVPVDVDPVHHALDPAAAQAAIGPRTAAIVPVDLYGRPAPHAALRTLAGAHGLLLVADSAQAHGARQDGAPVAAAADAACWSFYPGKNLGALGDGGAVTLGDDAVAARLRRLRNYGSERRYEHLERGTNSRLDELQAAILRVKLGRLEGWNARRRRIAARYAEGVAGTGVQPVAVPPGAEPSWHLYPVTSDRRDALREHLAASGVEALVHYPVAPGDQPAYAGTPAAAADLPVARAVAATELSLPIGPHLDDAAVERVVDAVRSFPA